MRFIYANKHYTRPGAYILLISRVGCMCLLLWPGELAARQPELRGGWSIDMPYQYEQINAAGFSQLSGIDIEVMKAASGKAGFTPVFEEITWGENLQALREGRLDFGLAATPEDSRKEWAWFSKPYRKESLAVFCRHQTMKKLGRGSALEKLQHLLESESRVAIVRGFYPGPQAKQLLARARDRGLVVETADDLESVSLLLDGRVEGFIADRLSAASAAGEANALSQLAVTPDNLYEAEVAFIFSKKTVSQEKFAAFELALENMRQSQEIGRIARHYLVPHLLLLTMQTVWFRAFDLIGTIAFAISGVIIARRENYDITGALVLAALPALGGGIMRDLMTNRSPIAILRTPDLLLIVLAVVLTGMVFFAIYDAWQLRKSRHMARAKPSPAAGLTSFRWASSRGMLEVSDAIGLATFTIVGVMVAIEQRCEPLWLWGPLLAAVTAAGGGVLRDILRSQADIPTLKGAIYPEIALFWGLVYSVFIITWETDLDLRGILLLTVCSVVGGLLSRLGVVHFRLESIFLGFPFRRIAAKQKPKADLRSQSL